MKYKHEDYEKGILINEYDDDTVTVELAYPRTNKIKFIEVGLCDVRATDNIRISFDFERSGWKIEQPYINEIQKSGYIDATIAWKEVGFYPNWNLEKITKIE
jgi:hypothetical protein